MNAALPWLSLGLLAAALIAAFGAITARSLFATCVNLIAAGVSVAAMVLLLGAGDGALAIALFAAAWTPVLLLAAMLLSARATKQTRRAWPWLSMLGALAALAAMWWPLMQIGAIVAAPSTFAARGMGFWIAPMLLAAGAACLGALGYGERGALARGDGG